MKSWNVRKEMGITPATSGPGQLPRTMQRKHLVLLGVGAIVGTGILTLIGVGAGKAGPAVLLSFVIAGFVCACAALAYALPELPESGDASCFPRSAAPPASLSSRPA